MTQQDLKAKLGKLIPAGLIVTIAVQAVMWLWWVAAFAATTTVRLADLEKHQLAMQQVPERIASLSTKVDGVSEQLVELRSLILKTHIREMKR